ncbi:hypothetical protein Ciccas_005472 [Cichlidogyrus casuarinus]|uniref:Secreted protein n=1 Tax=Cichlidogyrus casuarinus TaxID=1844966 RepID=A0ABD2Q9I2_9PLAT
MLFSLLAFLLVDLLRAFTVKFLRPLLQLTRFIFHMINSIFCDMIYLAAKGLQRSLQPLVDLCGAYSTKVIVPVTSSLVLVRREQKPIENV